MYALARHFAIRGCARLALRLSGCAGACAVISGCVGNPFADAKVDPDSPVAAEVARVASVNRAYPTFSDIPASPKDVRPPGQYGQAAKTIEQAAADLEAATAPDTWSLTGTDAFAAQARAAAGSEPAPTASDDTGAFARSARARATPPPPPRR
ncbi:hypothetical protein [Phenylobacterium sp.]|uniref:hypothetical protein n=1 Tax=Phenylobacterium sp. TaxID=1871053 RepID=UPI00263984E0|nr:hypothetical protein [Phenylobacterium sp.]